MKIYNKIVDKVLLCGLLFWPQISNALDIHDLRDTLSVLKPEYQQFSPVYGALYYELPILHFYLRYGNAQLAEDYWIPRSLSLL